MTKDIAHLSVRDEIYKLIRSRNGTPVSIDGIREELSLPYSHAQTIEFINILLIDNYIKDDPNDPILGSYVYNPAKIDNEGYVKRGKDDTLVKRINKGAAIAGIAGVILTLIFGLMAAKDSSQVKDIQSQKEVLIHQLDSSNKTNNQKTDSISLLQNLLTKKDTLKPSVIKDPSFQRN